MRRFLHRLYPTNILRGQQRADLHSITSTTCHVCYQTKTTTTIATMLDYFFVVDDVEHVAAVKAFIVVAGIVGTE